MHLNRLTFSFTRIPNINVTANEAAETPVEVTDDQYGVRLA